MVAQLYDALTKVRVRMATSNMVQVGDKYLHYAQPTWVSALDNYMITFNYQIDNEFFLGELQGSHGCRYKYLLPTQNALWSVPLPPVYAFSQREFLSNLEVLRGNVCSLVIAAESVTTYSNFFERERISADMYVVLPMEVTKSAREQSFSIKYLLEKLIEPLILHNFRYDKVIELPQFLNTSDTSQFAGEFLIYKGNLTWFKV